MTNVQPYVALGIPSLLVLVNASLMLYLFSRVETRIDRVESRIDRLDTRVERMQGDL